jgi:hypothetical protein
LVPVALCIPVKVMLKELHCVSPAGLPIGVAVTVNADTPAAAAGATVTLTV